MKSSLSCIPKPAASRLSIFRVGLKCLNGELDFREVIGDLVKQYTNAKTKQLAPHQEQFIEIFIWYTIAVLARCNFQLTIQVLY